MINRDQPTGWDSQTTVHSAILERRKLNAGATADVQEVSLYLIQRQAARYSASTAASMISDQVAPFVAPRLKIERARRHLCELERLISAFLMEKPCRLVVEPYPGMELFGSRAWVARISKNIPLSLSAVIGDVVHNLRTSLDLLACDLVRIKGESTKEVHFPFCERASELPIMIKRRKLHRAGPDVVKAIESLRPYKNGNIALRSIHDMDIADKHQALLPTLGAVKVPLASILNAGDNFPLSEFPTLIARDGQIIVGFPGAVSSIPLGTELPATYFLTFDEAPGFGRRQVLEFLHETTNVADGVINTLAALRPGAVFPPTSDA